MAAIPHEIIHGILPSLPPKSVVRFKCVCKAWKQHFESSDFIRNHLQKSLQPQWDHSSLILTCGSSLYIVDDLIDNASPRHRELTLPRSFHHNNGTIKVVGSCNGLLCIASGRGSNHYFVCNPTNPNNFKILPFASNRLSREGWRASRYFSPNFIVISGFGYDHIGGDYKIVYGWFQDNHYTEYDSEVMVYSSIVGSWKSIGNPAVGTKWSTNSILFNNRLHWIVSDHKVVCIGLHDEQWYEIDLPDCWLKCCVRDICVFRGCLSAIFYIHGEAELWAMKDYNLKDSWERLFSLPNDTSRVLYYSMRRDQALLLVDEVHCDWYSLKEKKIIQRVNIQADIKFSCVESFVGSIVPVITKRLDQGSAQESVDEDQTETTQTTKLGESSVTRNRGRGRRKKRNQLI